MFTLFRKKKPMTHWDAISTGKYLNLSAKAASNQGVSLEAFQKKHKRDLNELQRYLTSQITSNEALLQATRTKIIRALKPTFFRKNASKHLEVLLLLLADIPPLRIAAHPFEINIFAYRDAIQSTMIILYCETRFDALCDSDLDFLFSALTMCRAIDAFAAKHFPTGPFYEALREGDTFSMSTEAKWHDRTDAPELLARHTVSFTLERSHPQEQSTYQDESESDNTHISTPSEEMRALSLLRLSPAGSLCDESRQESTLKFSRSQ